MGRPPAPRYRNRAELLAAAQAVARVRLDALLGEPWRDEWTSYFKVTDEAIARERTARRLIAEIASKKTNAARAKAEERLKAKLAKLRDEARELRPGSALIGTAIIQRNDGIPKRALMPVDATASRSHLAHRVRAGLPNAFFAVNHRLHSLTSRGLAYVSLLVGHVPEAVALRREYTVDEIVDLEERAMHVADLRHGGRAATQRP